MDSMQWQDLEVVLCAALERELQQRRHDENLANILDHLHFYIQSEYTSWTTDPNDPDVKRERDKRKAAGIKPPKYPPIYPVAQRHPDLADALREVFREQADKHARPPERPAVSVAEALRMWG